MTVQHASTKDGKLTTGMARKDAIDRLANDRFDLLVIGGGIVGSGVVRDAAMRGLRACLIDQYDFASGTSSRSSRLLHGGLRYLEQGRVFLVREASVEKKIVQKIAPHLVHPLGFAFPSYRGVQRPLWQLKIGVKLYDLLCSGKNFQPSRGLTPDETLEMLPGIKRDGLAGSAFYFDALTNDARLVLDTLRSAAAHGATVLNYAKFLDARRHSGYWNCELIDSEKNEPFRVQAKTIVNATGPWADRLPHSKVQLRLSKGIHVVLSSEQLPVKSAAVITQGKRILFVIPWGDRVVVGTTDTDFAGDPEAVSTNSNDVEYVLTTLKSYFPEVNVDCDNLVSVWAGLRPLIADPNGSPSDISRAHQIQSPEPYWWDVAGGKLTTYRLMAEQTIDRVAKESGLLVQPCRTASEPLLATDETEFSGITSARWCFQAIEQYVANEWSVHLDDVLIRRGGWAHYAKLTEAQLNEVANWMATAAGWEAKRRDEELQRVRDILRLQTTIVD